MYAWIQRNLKGDPIIWGVVIVLSLLSLAVVYSATGSLAFRKMDGNTEYYLFKHGALLLGGLVCMLFFHRVDYRYLRKLSRLAMFASIPLLLFTYLFARSVNDASRWLTIPIINQGFQPSDLAKLALIAYLAGQLDRNQNNIEKPETLWPIFGWVGAICGLIALSNFSTAAMLLATCLLLMLIGRVPAKYMAYLAGLGVLAGTAAFFLGQRGATLLSRISAFLGGKEIPFQAQQAYIAIANGGFFGQGPGNSYQKDFLPHPYSDFIYAIIVEEWGLIGALVVLALYLVLLYRGMVAVARSQNAFAALLSAGLSFSLAIQAMLNMAVAVGLVPITGQPLPMLSMGGTSLLFTGTSLGIILSVSRGNISESLSGTGRSAEKTTGNAFRRKMAAAGR